MKKITFLLLFLFSSAFAAPNYKIISDPTFVLSYPRSGNTWLRYCLEYLADASSISATFLTEHSISSPISLPLLAHKKRSLIHFIKAHEVYQVSDCRALYPSIQKPTVVLILRNPFEAIPRYTGSFNLTEVSSSYFSVIHNFDALDIPKVVVYYEDLITDPENTLRDLLEQLGYSAHRLSAFLKNYAKHKEAAIALYEEHNAPSYTRGNSLIYHSLDLPAAERASISENFLSTYPEICEKYLMRYF